MNQPCPDWDKNHFLISTWKDQKSVSSRQPNRKKSSVFPFEIIRTLWITACCLISLISWTTVSSYLFSLNGLKINVPISIFTASWSVFEINVFVSKHKTHGFNPLLGKKETELFTAINIPTGDSITLDFRRWSV